MSRKNLKGKIRKYSSEYSIYCALCDFESTEHWHTKKDMEWSAKNEGWSKTVKHGWVCPNCGGRGEDDVINIKGEEK